MSYICAPVLWEAVDNVLREATGMIPEGPYSLARLRDWAGQEQRAVALFGSRANDCAVEDSDWNLLVVSPRGLSTVERFGNVRIQHTTANPEFLASGIATHVLGYGRWFHGSPLWTLADVNWDAAMRDYLERIYRQANALATYSMKGGPLFDKEISQLRITMQRAQCVQRKQVIPPNVMLPKLEDLAVVAIERAIWNRYGNFTFHRDIFDALHSDPEQP